MAADDKPKSQPSVKHALNDVLQNLQDLVRNELSGEIPAAAPPRDIPVLTDLVQAPPHPPARAKTKGVQTELPLGDTLAASIPVEIPVLQDVIVPPARPAAARARAVAIDLVARIDGLLREGGKPALDPAMIARLEQLLRDTLEAWAAAPSDAPERR